MPATKITKPLKTSKSHTEEVIPVNVRTRRQSELKVPSVRRNRAASCPRCPPRERSEAAPAGPHVGPKTMIQRRTPRSSSTAPKLTAERTKENSGVKKTDRYDGQAAVQAKYSQGRACNGQTQAVKPTVRRHNAFTVIPPEPKKRLEIQRKADAELAALEELRLSRVMAYVSISPSTVGGSLSLEEVRLKQQQEMVQAKHKPKRIKKPVMVLTS